MIGTIKDDFFSKFLYEKFIGNKQVPYEEGKSTHINGPATWPTASMAGGQCIAL